MRSPPYSPIKPPESVLTFIASERAITQKAKKALKSISSMGKTNILVSTAGTPRISVGEPWPLYGIDALISRTPDHTHMILRYHCVQPGQPTVTSPPKVRAL